MPSSSRGMYIMPDGRSLASVVESTTAYETKRTGSNRKTGKGRKKQTDAFDQQRGASSMPCADVETSEVMRLGRDRRRRAMADKLLRDMAGNLTFSAIEALFKPAPFGDTGHVSPWTEAAYPENAGTISYFLNIDTDVQKKVLQAWEEHIRQEQQQRKHESGPSVDVAQLSPAYAALKSWSSVPRKARDALRKANLSTVDELEHPIFNFLKGSLENPTLEYCLADSFHRLLVHGLADFHGLVSQSDDEEGGVRRTTLRFPKRRTPGGAPEFSCGDLLMALDAAQPLTPEGLALYMAQHFSQDAV